jgi:energy-coupling factor transporter transmembrane protein EcfT
LRWVRVNPQAVTLTIALMIRSIPFLAGAVQDARDAARARGKDRNPALLLTPAVVGAVAYAERTGEALHARGLPEDLQPEPVWSLSLIAIGGSREHIQPACSQGGRRHRR